MPRGHQRRLLRALQAPEELLEGDAEAFGEGDDGVEGGSVLAALDHADAVAVDPCSLAETLLGQPSLFAEVADAFAEQATVLCDPGHATGP